MSIMHATTALVAPTRLVGASVISPRTHQPTETSYERIYELLIILLSICYLVGIYTHYLM